MNDEDFIPSITSIFMGCLFAVLLACTIHFYIHNHRYDEDKKYEPHTLN